jgi:hypothetical protein
MYGRDLSNAKDISSLASATSGIGLIEAIKHFSVHDQFKQSLQRLAGVDLQSRIQGLGITLRDAMEQTQESNNPLYVFAPSLGMPVANFTDNTVPHTVHGKQLSDSVVLDYEGNPVKITTAQLTVQEQTIPFVDASGIRKNQQDLTKVSQTEWIGLYVGDPKFAPEGLVEINASQLLTVMYLLKRSRRRIADLMDTAKRDVITHSEVQTFNDSVRDHIRYERDDTQSDGRKRGRDGKPVRAVETRTLAEFPSSVYFKTSTQHPSFGNAVVGDTPTSGIVLGGTDTFASSDLVIAKGILVRA